MKKTILTAIFYCVSLIMALANSSWRFAVVGDTHVPNAYTVKKIVPRLLEDKVEVVLFVGDLVQGGKGQNANGLEVELEEWKNLTRPLTEAGIKVLAIRGNHEDDVRGNNIGPWKKIISSDLNVVYSYKNVTFVGLDNYINGERTVDTGWLSKTLESADKNDIIVPFGHEPAFSCNTFHPVCLDANPENRNEFWGLLEKYGIGYYFCGHTHQYNLSSITHNGKTIQQVVCGGSGGFLQPEKGGIKETKGYDVKSVEVRSETGYLLVEVNANRLSPKWIHVYDKNVKTKPDRLKRRR
ncbi:metallophosphoesterase [uncultured Bacteroides sp.]|uniref:metallophosphoesterase family protein n=1 Tax=uncultured Bacteroides sp. TaxID=162156 RepID=UPI0026226C67|nr:metallophosphoesterase [uncultured Bacteroides sp.]